MKNSHSVHMGKKTVLFLLSILLVSVILTVDQLVSAAPTFSNQKSTLTNQERQLEIISSIKEQLKKQTNPTAKSRLENDLKHAEMEATREANVETLMPTYNALAKTAIVNSTEEAKKHKGDNNKPHSLKPQNSGLMSIPLFGDLKKYNFSTTWKDPIDEINAVFYSAGSIKDTNQAIIYWYDSQKNVGYIYIANGYTGSIKIVDKQDQYLVLKAKSGADLYFDTITKEFTVSMVGTVTPITTIMPSITPVFKSTPLPPYPAP